MPDTPPFRLARAPAQPDLTTDDNGVTFLIVSAGGPAVDTLYRLRVELDTGRRVSVVATPTAAAWFDHYEVGPVIESMTGWPIRSRMPEPSVPTFEPQGSRLIASPCTLNTLTKWAGGHCDNLALSLLCEAIGRGVPTMAEVSISGPYAEHPAARDALERLASVGVALHQAHGAGAHPLLQPLPPAVAGALTRLQVEAGSG